MKGQFVSADQVEMLNDQASINDTGADWTWYNLTEFYTSARSIVTASR